MTDKALNSLIKEVKQHIKRSEGNYANRVIDDYDDEELMGYLLTGKLPENDYA